MGFIFLPLNFIFLHSKKIVPQKHEYEIYKPEIYNIRLIFFNIINDSIRLFLSQFLPIFFEKKYFLLIFRINKKNGQDNF